MQEADDWTEVHVKQTPEDRLDAADRLVSGRLEDMLDWCVTPKKEERVKKEMKIQTEAPVVADQENKKPVQTRRKLKTGPSKAEIRRCARRGGVVRMSGTIYEETQNCLATFLRPILRDSVVYAEHANRKTIYLIDVMHALKRNNRTLYGVK